MVLVRLFRVVVQVAWAAGDVRLVRVVRVVQVLWVVREVRVL